MNIEEFKSFAKTSIDYIAEYIDTIRDRHVISSVSPGYLERILPEKAPRSGENWQILLEDVDRYITPGLSHWSSPHFHAYYPTANSYPAIVAELLLSGLGTIATDWSSSPASVELELKMMDWLCKLLNLPKYFLNSSNSHGGGIIQNAASESTLVGFISAKSRKIKEILQTTTLPKEEIGTKLVAYTSEQSNSSVEKSGLLASVPMRLLPTDKNGALRGKTLLEAIKIDKQKGLIPCYVVATLGTTGICAFDNLEEIGLVCQRENLWLHVDAAYAGTALVCPEFRYIMKGIEFVDSFNFNPHKWMLVNSDCSAMWFKNTKDVEEAFKIKGIDKLPDILPDIQNLQIPSCRRFRSLKIWFVLRIYGVKGVQEHVRKQVALAKYFEHFVKCDEKFELCTSSLGVVCFRLKGNNKRTQILINKLTERKNIYVMPYYYSGKLVVRFVICSRLTKPADVEFAWNEVTSNVCRDEEYY